MQRRQESSQRSGSCKGERTTGGRRWDGGSRRWSSRRQGCRGRHGRWRCSRDGRCVTLACKGCSAGRACRCVCKCLSYVSACGQKLTGAHALLHASTYVHTSRLAYPTRGACATVCTCVQACKSVCAPVSLPTHRCPTTPGGHAPLCADGMRRVAGLNTRCVMLAIQHTD